MQNNKTVELNIVRDALFSDQTNSYLREENNKSQFYDFEIYEGSSIGFA